MHGLTSQKNQFPRSSGQPWSIPLRSPMIIIGHDRDMQMSLKSFLKMLWVYEQKFHARRNLYTMVQKNHIRISGNWGFVITFHKTHLSFFVYLYMPGSSQFADTIWSENQIPGFRIILWGKGAEKFNSSTFITASAKRKHWFQYADNRFTAPLYSRCFPGTVIEAGTDSS